MTWYSDEEVQSKVTHIHVLSRLPRDKQILLDEPLAGGDGLTDQTYGDWIVNKSPRLFLVLEDIGCPERVFDLVDKFIEDSDLPLRREDVTKLGLGYASSEKKFYRRQFAYQDQKLREGSHVEYESEEAVPVKLLAIQKGHHATIERVCVGEWELTRWHVNLNVDNQREKNSFATSYRMLQSLQHTHLVSIFATYTHRGNAFVLLNPYETNLRAFLDEPSKEFKQRSKIEQLDQLLRWIRCLISVVAYLHNEGIPHQAIRPSNIFLTADNIILLGPPAGPSSPVEDCSPIATNAYLSPEQWPGRSVKASQVNKRPSLHRRARSIPRLTHSRQQSQASFRSLPQSAASTPAVPTLRNRQHSADAVLSPTLPRSRYKRTSVTSSTGSPESKPLPLSLRKGSVHISQLQSRRRRASSTRLVQNANAMQSDVFSLFAVTVEILSLFTCIARSSNKFSINALHTHLLKNRGTSRKAEDSSFQSNLFQVHTWLDSLVESADTKSSRKLPRLLTNINGSKGSRDNFDLFQYTVILSSTINIVRQGLERSPGARLTATEALSRIDEALSSWKIPVFCVCSKSFCTAVQYTSSTPITAVSPLSTRRETMVFPDDGGYLPSPLEQPSAKPGAGPWDKPPPVPAIPLSSEHGERRGSIERLSSVSAVLPPVEVTDGNPVKSLPTLATQPSPPSEKPRLPDLELLSPLRTPNVLTPRKTRSPSPAANASGPPSKLNAILDIAASQPLKATIRSNSPPLSIKHLSPLLIPKSPSHTVTQSDQFDNLAVTPTFQISSNLRLQSKRPAAELASTDADCSSTSSSDGSEGSSTEDSCWFPPTPTSTLFHPTVYALAASAWEEDPNDDSLSVHSLSLDSLKRNDSQTTVSPTPVTTSRGPSPAFDDEKEVVLPIYLSPSDSQSLRQPFDMLDDRPGSDSVHDYSAPIYSDSEYSDDESVIIALDVYEVPRPLKMSGQVHGATPGLQRIGSRNHHRSRTSLGLRKSRTWANLGDSLGAKAGMGAGEDVGRAKFRGRWQERLNRRGTVTTTRPQAQTDVVALTPGPRTGPAVLVAEEDPRTPPPIQEMRKQIDGVLDETRDSSEIARGQDEDDTWWGLEWGQWRRKEGALQRTHTVRRESVWMKQRRQRQRQSMVRFGSA